MEPFEIRPATQPDVDDAQGVFPRIALDHWAPGGNRRSFVAVDPSGHVIGFCRAVDNAAHPNSRVMALKVSDDLDTPDAVRDRLLEAQLAVSTVPLHMKIYAHQAAELALAHRFGGVAIQLTPPWSFVVNDDMRAWADRHTGATEPIRDRDRQAIRELETDHYLAQHAGWNPAASRDEMLAYFAEDHEPGSPSAWDPQRSVLIRRDGEVVAAGLLWPDANGAPSEGREVTLQAWPYEGLHTRADKEACLAVLIHTAHDGDALLIDSHQTEALERDMMAAIPGRSNTPTDTWMAIVAIPVPAAPPPAAIDSTLIPEAASWARILR